LDEDEKNILQTVGGGFLETSTSSKKSTARHFQPSANGIHSVGALREAPNNTTLKNIRYLALLTFLIIIILLAACDSTRGPAPVERNDQWKPFVREFNDVEMVQVPPGCFLMGSDYGRRDELPVHEICFEEAFWIDRYEVTNGQYGSQGPQPGENHPRTNLTWEEARDHCANRDARLPTEAEWEYAARGPDNLIYPWGDELEPARLVFDRNLPAETSPVGSRESGESWVGAMDMSGNVFEWVSSLYRPYPYDATDGREVRDSDEPRVYRSGLHSYIDYGVSTSIRFWLNPDERDWFIGFRCARSE